jgi:hypothetical protein
MSSLLFLVRWNKLPLLESPPAPHPPAAAKQFAARVEPGFRVNREKLVEDKIARPEQVVVAAGQLA